MWIARDRDGRLRLFYESEPTKGETYWIDIEGQNIELPRYILPEIKWEDDLPARILVRDSEDRKLDDAFDEAITELTNALLKHDPT